MNTGLLWTNAHNLQEQVYNEHVEGDPFLELSDDMKDEMINPDRIKLRHVEQRKKMHELRTKKSKKKIDRMEERAVSVDYFSKEAKEKIISLRSELKKISFLLNEDEKSELIHEIDDYERNEKMIELRNEELKNKFSAIKNITDAAQRSQLMFEVKSHYHDRRDEDRHFKHLVKYQYFTIKERIEQLRESMEL